MINQELKFFYLFIFFLLVSNYDLRKIKYQNKLNIFKYNNFKEIKKYTNLDSNILNFNSKNLNKRFSKINFCKNYYHKLNLNGFQKDLKYMNLSLIRGVFIHFSLYEFNKFKIELKWLYRSWINILEYEPKLWRTDLIIFLDIKILFNNDKFANFFKNLNCSIHNKRIYENEPSKCILINYEQIRSRTYGEPFNKKKIYDYNFFLNKFEIFNTNNENIIPFNNFILSLKNYKFADSILIAFDGYDYFKRANYNFLLRTDIDTFLTPYFSRWVPENCNDFYAGKGSYSVSFNNKKLKNIHKLLKIGYSNITNIGSTWISTSENLRLASFYSCLFMVYLKNEEFPEPQYNFSIDAYFWPYWHYGVLSMYANQMSLNFLHSLKIINLKIKPNQIDVPSYNYFSIDNILHVHAFLSDKMFSKDKFKNGFYKNRKICKKNLKKIKYYSLGIAFETYKNNESFLYHLYKKKYLNRNFNINTLKVIFSKNHPFN